MFFIFASIINCKTCFIEFTKFKMDEIIKTSIDQIKKSIAELDEAALRQYISNATRIAFKSNEDLATQADNLKKILDRFSSEEFLLDPAIPDEGWLKEFSDAMAIASEHELLQVGVDLNFLKTDAVGSDNEALFGKHIYQMLNLALNSSTALVANAGGVAQDRKSRLMEFKNLAKDLFSTLYQTALLTEVEKKQNFLQSLATIDLRCIGGIGSGVLDNFQAIMSEGPKTLFYRANELCKAQFAEMIKPFVREEAHAHIGRYLEYILSLRTKEELLQKDRGSLVSVGYVPSDVIINICSHYSQKQMKILRFFLTMFMLAEKWLLHPRTMPSQKPILEPPQNFLKLSRYHALQKKLLQSKNKIDRTTCPII